jgi:Kef-type K+ transport system membrane component KefB
MVPRGEVGLVFVSAGSGLAVDGVPLLDAQASAAIVLMVAVTTFLGPYLFAARLRR